jgi:class 3 adenylate cyclase
MVTLRATAIMKTDISGSTPRFRSLPEQDLTALLAEHRDFVTRLATPHDGRIVKPEGDGYWLVFPSVTAGALAAMAMQEELRLAEASKGDRRLAMRIVITLGDVLLQEGALVGDAVVLATRIEALTPPHEIYLSAAAWLAVNQAEVRTALVDAFALKGFPGQVPVYRIEQTYRTRVIVDQYIVMTDLRRFSAVVETGPMTQVEKILDRLHALVGNVCRDFSGTTHFSVGDSYCLTFPDARLAITAVEHLAGEWRAPGHREGALCPMGVAVHKGVLYAFRDFVHSRDVNIAAAVERVARNLFPADTVVLVTGQVQGDLVGSEWDKRFQRVDVRPSVPVLADIEIYRLGNC